jgi:hypothetical protein
LFRCAHNPAQSGFDSADQNKQPSFVLGIGHESLSIIIRYALILLSVLDPASRFFFLGMKEKYRCGSQ